MPHTYTLIFNLSELMIKFAFNWPVYVLMYLAINLVLILEILFLLFYHYIANRQI